MIPGEANDFSGVTNVDPNAYWVPLHKPVLTLGQTFHLGDNRTWFTGGSWGINAHCDDIPLLTTYCDYFYSPEGIFDENYGAEGVTFTYNEKGEPQLTDLLIKHPSGMSWALLQYSINDVMEGGVCMRARTYAFPGGERLNDFHAFWNDSAYYKYDGSMAWPTAITLDAQSNARISELGADIATFISENFLLFVDGTKPLSEWDAYVTDLRSFGWDECLTIYQNAYDGFIERFA
jgi:putative aldouronate transport system substrate-binding protein